MVRTAVLCILLCGYLSSAPAQDADPKDNSEATELKALIDALRAENSALKEEVEALRKAQTSAVALSAENDTLAMELDELKLVLSEEKQKIADFSRVISDLKATRVIQEVTHAEQMVALEAELNALDQMQEELEQKHNTVSASAIASTAMANRLAEAQIDNRLQLLESEAMVDVIKRLRANGSLRSAEAEVAVERARLLLDQRKAELMGIFESSSSPELTSRERAQVKNQMEVAKIKVQDAELLVREAQSRMADGAHELDERLAEAVIQLAVSKQIEKALSDEASKLKELSDAGADFDQIKHQRRVLQQQLADLKRAAIDQQAQLRAKEMELQNESQRLQNDILLPLRIREQDLRGKLGEGHPALKSVRAEIEMVNNQIIQMKDLREKGLVRPEQKNQEPAQLLEASLLDLKAKLNSVEDQFGSKHPKAEMLKKQIEVAERELQSLDEEKGRNTNSLLLRSNQIENDVLIPLKIRQEVLLEKYGKDHPSVRLLSKEIESVKKQIDTLKQSQNR